MTLAAIAGTSFLLGPSGAVMPGPLLTVIIAESMRFGLWAGPLLVAGHATRVVGVVIFCLCHILSDFVWYSFVSETVTFGRCFLSDRGYRILIGGCALFIRSFGVYLGARGLKAQFG